MAARHDESENSGPFGAAFSVGEGSRRVLFASSSGGHLSQLLQLRSWWTHHERQWVTFDLPDARSKLEGEILIPAHHPTTRNIPNMLRNLGLAVRVVRQFRPDVIVSNGAGVAVPFFVVAKLLRIPTVYIEVYDRIDSRTMTGRLCAPLASLFLVQWPEQQELYPSSVLVGPLY
jgi:UDP-N-acetylglucosamine:LPS N-acetylglucosamine transferase